MWIVYILQCADNSLYTGVTTDIEQRVKKHNSKSGAEYTKFRTPVKVIYHEQYESKSEALKREFQIKSWKRSKKIVLINGDKELLKKLSA